MAAPPPSAPDNSPAPNSFPAPAPPMATADRPSTPDPPATDLGVAVFGAGIIAHDAHHHALTALARDRVRVLAVWSRTATHASALAARYDPPAAWHTGPAGVDAILDMPAVHAAVLAVPIPELAVLASRCRAAGKHVLSEKPIAHCLRAAREVLALPSPALYAVAENFRFEGGVAAAAIDAARLNPVCISLVAAMHMPPESKFATPWRLRPRHVGAQLLDGGVHFVAALRMAANSDVVRVAAAASTASMHLPSPDSTSAMLEFANGVHATMLISYAAAEFVWEMRVIATDGDLCLKRVKSTPGYMLETRHGGKSVTKQYPFSGIDEEFKCFFDCCRSGEMDDRIDARSAFNDLATIEALVESAETGRSVMVEQLEKLQ